jgi:hypothetical protein
MSDGLFPPKGEESSRSGLTLRKGPRNKRIAAEKHDGARALFVAFIKFFDRRARFSILAKQSTGKLSRKFAAIFVAPNPAADDPLGDGTSPSPGWFIEHASGSREQRMSH